MSTYRGYLSWVTWLSSSKDRKIIPQRDTNGSVLAGVALHCVCECACVRACWQCSVCIVSINTHFFICPHMSVCLHQRELQFCRIWMRVWLMAQVLFFPSFPPVSICPCPIPVCAHMLVSLHSAGCSALIIWLMHGLGFRAVYFKTALRFQSGWLEVHKDSHYNIPNEWQKNHRMLKHLWILLLFRFLCHALFEMVCLWKNIQSCRPVSMCMCPDQATETAHSLIFFKW